MSFLQRSRIVLTALVILAGLGSTLIAMKPAEKMAAYTYGVTTTNGGTHYKIKQDITGLPRTAYDCDNETPTACRVGSATPLTLQSEIPVNQVSVIENGDFIPQNP